MDDSLHLQILTDLLANGQAMAALCCARSLARSGPGCTWTEEMSAAATAAFHCSCVGAALPAGFGTASGDPPSCSTFRLAVAAAAWLAAAELRCAAHATKPAQAARASSGSGHAPCRSMLKPFNPAAHRVDTPSGQAAV